MAQLATEIERHESFISTFTGAVDGEHSQRLGPRSSRAERQAAADFLEERLHELGLDVKRHEYAHPNIHPVLDLFLPPMRGVNIYVEIKATRHSDHYVIVGAHYDTAEGSPGADDNASGVSTLLTVAERISNQSSRSINYIFVFFDQEEDDLGPGSKTFAQYLLDRDLTIHSMHNVDMIGYDGNENRTLEVEVPDNLRPAYLRAANDWAMELRFVRFNSSDHIPFRDLGIDAICLGEEVSSGDLNPHYHSAQDIVDHIDFEFLARGSLLVGDVLASLEAPS
ncbi:MAG: M28 family peptidase [Pseudomonadota bacterium]